MKKIKKINGLFLIMTATIILTIRGSAVAEAEQSGVGTVDFKGAHKREIYDPENPTEVVNPSSSPYTNGKLRIDFVPKINFGANQITSHDMTAYANAQLFLGDSIGPRANFIQVTDIRGNDGGWQLQVKQEQQFRNDDTINQELNGAVMSFDRAWTSSQGEAKYSPLISNDVIRMENIGETYNIAEAKKGNGQGTWAISFGASINNDRGFKNTLTPRLDQANSPVLDEAFGKQPVYQNNMVSLAIPRATAIDPVPYKTVLTWTLSELP